jgi:serine/threonine protein kinase
MRIYNHKGLEIDDSDIYYLKDKQVVYLSLDGSPFSVLNYVNEYEIVKWIKSGGYGIVYLARHVITNEIVAIKKVDISSLSTEEMYNITRESLYLETFKHKNIIKFINSYVHENSFYNVMENAEGGELNKYLCEKGPLGEVEAKKIFKQLHDSVKYIHSRNVIHRDLKPNNVLFLDENKENIVLIDFGISGFYHGNIKETIKAGTTKFIPPELASGLNYSSSPKLDVWALGVILYLMLFGVYPFDANKDSDISNKIINEKHKFPSSIIVSSAVKKLINGLLEKNPNMRIGINDQLFEIWYEDEKASEKAIFREEVVKLEPTVIQTEANERRSKFKNTYSPHKQSNSRYMFILNGMSSILSQPTPVGSSSSHHISHPSFNNYTPYKGVENVSKSQTMPESRLSKSLHKRKVTMNKDGFITLNK